MGMPNGPRVHWAMDSQLVAERVGISVQLPLPFHECHCSEDPSVGCFHFKPVLEGQGMEDTPSHSF
jgi:hypothetical protein